MSAQFDNIILEQLLSFKNHESVVRADVAARMGVPDLDVLDMLKQVMMKFSAVI